jgi:hypothetical protein
MDRAIAGFHQDEDGDWVAELSCGHAQHVRHRPPFHLREWVVEDKGRQTRIGTPLDCPLCERQIAQEGGETACWAHLLCADCGVVLDGGPHRDGCVANDERQPMWPVT